MPGLTEETRSLLQEQIASAELHALTFLAQGDIAVGAECVGLWKALNYILMGQALSTSGFQDNNPFDFIAVAARERLKRGNPHYEIPQLGVSPVQVCGHADEAGVKECISARGACGLGR